jgi:hypothetical protein
MKANRTSIHFRRLGRRLAVTFVILNGGFPISAQELAMPRPPLHFSA